jgi:hypothetical protein
MSLRHIDMIITVLSTILVTKVYTVLPYQPSCSVSNMAPRTTAERDALKNFLFKAVSVQSVL